MGTSLRSGTRQAIRVSSLGDSWRLGFTYSKMRNGRLSCLWISSSFLGFVAFVFATNHPYACVSPYRHLRPLVNSFRAALMAMPPRSLNHPTSTCRYRRTKRQRFFPFSPIVRSNQSIAYSLHSHFVFFPPPALHSRLFRLARDFGSNACHLP